MGKKKLNKSIKKKKQSHPSTIWSKDDFEPYPWKKGNWFCYENDEKEEEKKEE